ncbi:MAG: hypothetical protein PHO63_01885 [Bacilli bacterium]|nr:hypothetical protein [Bacilli bacterium]MDD4808983.1 hypothetical protein [Bacilli bacterium]
MINLKELNLGTSIKCTCEQCKGTGIYKGFAEKDNLGVICHHCNGKGYQVLNLENDHKLYQNEEDLIIYHTKQNIISKVVHLFTKKQTRDDIDYVIYEVGRYLSPTWLLENGADEYQVIRYQNFLNGGYPLPLKDYTCPLHISQCYGEEEFYNDCDLGLPSQCQKYGEDECWDKFYNGAITIKEKQLVLKNLK